MEVASRFWNGCCLPSLQCAASRGLLVVDVRGRTICLPAGAPGIRLQEPGQDLPLRKRAVGLRIYQPGAGLRRSLCGLAEHVDTTDAHVPEYGHAGSQRGRRRPDGPDHYRGGAARGRPATQGAVVVRSEPTPSVGLRLWRASLRVLRRPVVWLSRYSSVFIWRPAARHALMVGGASAETLGPESV